MEEIERLIGYTFRDPAPLKLAFVHRSYVNETKGALLEHNERLELLGDAVLELIVSDFLFHKMPDVQEGSLSERRASLVSAQACRGYVQKLGIEDFLLMGRGEKLNQGRGRDSLMADLFEALLGAIYLDGGLEAAREFLFAHFDDEMNEALVKPAVNFKALLQDYAQKKFKNPPLYEVVGESGPDHDRLFHVEVSIDGEVVGRAEGSSKKVAGQKAAEAACEQLDIHG